MAKKKSLPKRWWVSPPDEIRDKVLERCEESMRPPGVEVVFILREWFRDQEAAAAAEERERTKDENLDEALEETQ